ncbi:MAG TPA: ornithine cyclodeaminase family protein [Candidatus Nanoarchaeia archaeon]|nr:ornithine cyclodeaminase family protein [Candidatus Nanoarchaeia archaeon]
MHSTLILKQSEIEKLIDMKTAVGLVEDAFRMHATEQADMPPKVYLDFPRGDIRAMPAYLKGKVNMGGVKIVNVHPENKFNGLISVRGTTVLIDPANGVPLSIMDATFLTALRTGAASGVATKYLANKNAKRAAIVGIGGQAESQLLALATVMPNLEEIVVYDKNHESAKSFAIKHKALAKIRACREIRDCIKDADIITTLTPVRSPVIYKDMVKPGAHINAIGADAAGKQELQTELTTSSAVFVDDWEQASHSGEINVPIAQGKFGKEMMRATLGEVVAGMKKGRQSEEEITIFDSTGLAIQDIIVSNYVYKAAMKNPDKYNSIDLLS